MIYINEILICCHKEERNTLCYYVFLDIFLEKREFNSTQYLFIIYIKMIPAARVRKINKKHAVFRNC